MKRLEEHYDETASKFTKKHQLKDLIFIETFLDINQAITREKQLKNWNRAWKLNLIRNVNPTLKTLEY